jgi:hypothetical protein
MKKATITSLLLLIMVFIGTSANAQDDRREAGKGKDPAFDIGDKTIALSIGFGADYSYNYYDGYAPVILPAFGVSYDQGIIEAGPGVVGIGGIIVGQFSHYDGPYGINATYANYVIGARGTWHLSILKDKNNKFDPYGGVLIGLRFFNYSETYDHYSSTSVNPAFGLFVGAKYNFAEHVGAFAELGVDVSLLRFGLNFNF